MSYNYKPTQLLGPGGVLRASFNGVSDPYQAWFDPDNGPQQMRGIDTVEAEVIGLGPQHVRSQPKGSFWRLYVQLKNLGQSDLNALLAAFDEMVEHYFLVVQDGSATTWRSTACRLVGFEREGSGNRFVATFRLAEPWLQASILHDHSFTAQFGGTSDPMPTNIGNRHSPVVELQLEPNAARNRFIDEYALSFRGFIVNKSPFYWNNLPVQLCDQSGTHQVVNHSGFWKVTTIGNLLNGGINASATTINIDGPFGGGLPSSGMAIIDNEQISYTNNTGTQLTGVVRGIGGTTAASHSDNAQVFMSQGLDNGDDIRVWVNDVEVDRYLDGLKTTSMRVWANVTMPAAMRFTLKKSITPTVPATGGELELVESTEGLPPSGFVAIRDELIHYQSRSGTKLFGIQRGAWGTTAISANPALFIDSVWRCDTRYVVSLGKATADTAPSDPAKRPAIELNRSTNFKWFWGDTAQDSQTVFWDVDNPDRPASWVPRLDNQGNQVLAIRLEQSKSAVEFKDADIIAGRPPFNRLDIFLPQYAVSVGGSVDTAAHGVIGETWAIDRYGIDRLLRRFANEGTGLGYAQAVNDLAAGLSLKGRYGPVTGLRSAGASDIDLINQFFPSGNADWTIFGILGQSFTLDQQTRIESINLLLEINSSSQQYQVAIMPDNGGLPDTRIESTLLRLYGSISSGTHSTAKWTSHPCPPNFALAAGTYWILLGREINNNGTIEWKINPSDVYGRGRALRCQGGNREEQWVGITGSPSGGTFRLVLNAVETGDIAYNASAAAMETALEALPGVTSVTVPQSSPTIPYWQIIFDDVYYDAGGSVFGDRPFPQLQAGTNNLTGGTNPSVVINRLSAADGNTFWEELRDRDFNFEIVGSYQSDGVSTFIQADQPEYTLDGDRLETSVSFTRFEATLNGSTCPYVHRIGTNWTSQMYYLSPSISINGVEGGGQIDVRQWVRIGQSLRIQPSLRKATTEGGRIQVTGAVFPIVPSGVSEEWLTVPPGDNNVDYDEPDVPSLGVDVFVGWNPRHV